MNDLKRFINHAKKVIRNVPEFHQGKIDGVRLLHNGCAAVTDSHRLYFIQDVHSGEVDEVISVTGKRLDYNYPEINRLIPSNNPIITLELEVKEFLEAMDFVKVPRELMDELPIVLLKENKASCSYGKELKASYDLSVDFEESFHSNATYWVDALKMFKDFGYGKAKFNFFGRMRPFTLVSEDERITALILPIRSY